MRQEYSRPHLPCHSSIKLIKVLNVLHAVMLA